MYIRELTHQSFVLIRKGHDSVMNTSITGSPHNINKRSVDTTVTDVVPGEILFEIRSQQGYQEEFSPNRIVEECRVLRDDSDLTSE